MKGFYERAIEGTNLKNLYRDGYKAGKLEQLEQDVSMLEDILLKSSSCDDFMETLSLELVKIKREMELGY